MTLINKTLILSLSLFVTNLAFSQTFTLNSNIPNNQLTVSLNSLPSVVTPPDTLYPVASVSGGLPPYTYSWTPTIADFQFPGNNDAHWLVLSATDTFTVFNLTVTDSNGCVSVAPFSITNTVGISDLDETYALRLFPNPSNGAFHLSLDSKISSAEISVEVSDLSGRVVYSERIKNNTGKLEHNIDLTDAAKGIFLLTVRLNEKQIIQQIIID